MNEDMQDEAPEALRQDLTCPVCQSIFSDPVLLPCTHTFCWDCLQRSWQVNKRCPICREPFTEAQAIGNRDLKNACETFLRQTNWRSPPKPPDKFSCNRHLKPLELFCEWDAIPVCVDCATDHSTHRLLSLKDAVPLCKSELNDKGEHFEKKAELYEKMQHKLSKTAEYVMQQRSEAEKQIKAEFERLHNFLHAEENMRLQALATEEEQKITTIQDRITKTEEHIKTLRQHVDTITKELSNEDFPFLMNFQNVKIQTQWTTSSPQIANDCLLDMSKHVGSLGYNIWTKMKDCVQYYPVVLDANTASPWLALNPDLTIMKESPEPLPIPDNRERFDPTVFVLGAGGFTSGKHKWEVSVGDNPKWILGVCKESVVRKKTFTVSTTRGVWAIGLSKGMHVVFTPERPKLAENLRLEKIRVKLNMDKGEVSFWDAMAEKHLVSFTYKLERGEKIYPIFGPGPHSTPMLLLPGKIVIHAS